MSKRSAHSKMSCFGAPKQAFKLVNCQCCCRAIARIRVHRSSKSSIHTVAYLATSWRHTRLTPNYHVLRSLDVLKTSADLLTHGQVAQT